MKSLASRKSLIATRFLVPTVPLNAWEVWRARLPVRLRSATLFSQGTLYAEVAQRALQNALPAPELAPNNLTGYSVEPVRLLGIS